MSRLRGTFNYSANFEVKKTAPLDARLVVETKLDLITPATWEDLDSLVWLYKGIIVSVIADAVPENNGVYLLIGDYQNYEDYSYWVKIGGVVPTILTHDSSIEGNDATTEFAVVHNLNTLRQNIAIWDSSTNEEIYPAITRGSSTNYIAFHTPPSTGTIYNINITAF